MSRATAILLFLGLIGLLILTAITDPRGRLFGPDITMLWIHSGLTCVTIWSCVAYCAFATLHATQHITCPHKRSYWLIFIIAANIVGSCIYLCTKYQKFRAAGEGRLLPRKSVNPFE